MINRPVYLNVVGYKRREIYIYRIFTGVIVNNDSGENIGSH